MGTNGWLEKWKQRYYVRRVAICGKSGDVSGESGVTEAKNQAKAYSCVFGECMWGKGAAYFYLE